MVRNILRAAVPALLVSALVCFVIWKFAMPHEDAGTDPAEESEEVFSPEDGQESISETVGPRQAVRIPVKNENDTERTTVLTPGWHEDSHGRWYQNPDRTYFSGGFEEIEGVQYFFDDDGYLRTGWVTIGDKDYYFNADGSYNRDRKRSLIALTFNGGPSAFTDDLLDVLEENEAHATFFVKGQLVAANAGTIKRMTEIGCEVGSNSWDDLQLNLITLDEAVQKFRDTDEALEKACGQTARVARAPYNMANNTIYEAIGKPFFSWSLDAEDGGEKLDASAEYDIVMDANLEDGTIILMHDIYESSVVAAGKFIPELIEKGYKLVTVSEMAEARDVELQNTLYMNFLQSTLETGTVPGYLRNDEIAAQKAGAGG